MPDSLQHLNGSFYLRRLFNDEASLDPQLGGRLEDQVRLATESAIPSPGAQTCCTLRLLHKNS